MRPLPRLLAITDPAIVAALDFPIRAAAVAAGGPAVGIVVRAGTDRDGRLAALRRVRALTEPPEAATIADDPADGRIAGAHGVQLGIDAAIGVASARSTMGRGWVGVSVRSEADAGRARDDGADWIIAGPIFPTGAEPGLPPRGLGWLTDIVALGLPVFAVGGVTSAAVEQVRSAGAWGIAVGAAIWRAPDSARATEALLHAWTG